MRLLENRLLGFQECFAEVTRFLSALPVVSTVDEVFRKKLLSHLHACIYRRDYEARTRLASLSAMVSEGRDPSEGPSVSSVPDLQTTRDNCHTTVTTTNQSNWEETPLVKGANCEPHNVLNPPVYWQCNSNLTQSWNEHNWPQVDYHQNRNLKIQTAIVNESQSTTSPSMLGNYDETDSGNSTGNRFSPSERDISTDAQPLQSNQRYAYGHVECEKQAGMTGFHPGTLEGYNYGYHQNYPGPSTTDQHLHSQDQLATTSNYVLESRHSVSSSLREAPYYSDDF